MELERSLFQWLHLRVDGEFHTVTRMRTCVKVTQSMVCDVLKLTRLNLSVSQQHGAIGITVYSVSEQKATLLTCLILLKISCSKESFRGCEETRVFCWISWSVEGRVPAAQSSCVVTLNVYPNWLRLSPQANAMNIESYAMFLHENQTIPLAVVMPAESHTLWPQRFFCSVVTSDLIQQREPVAKVWRSRSSTTHSFSSCSKPGVWLTRMAPFWVLLL